MVRSPGRRPAEELAKLLLSVLLGIRVLARTRPQREVLEGAAQTESWRNARGRSVTGRPDDHRPHAPAQF